MGEVEIQSPMPIRLFDLLPLELIHTIFLHTAETLQPHINLANLSYMDSELPQPTTTFPTLRSAMSVSRLWKTIARPLYLSTITIRHPSSARNLLELYRADGDRQSIRHLQLVYTDCADAIYHRTASNTLNYDHKTMQKPKSDIALDLVDLLRSLHRVQSIESHGITARVWNRVFSHLGRSSPIRHNLRSFVFVHRSCRMELVAKLLLTFLNLQCLHLTSILPSRNPRGTSKALNRVKGRSKLTTLSISHLPVSETVVSLIREASLELGSLRLHFIQDLSRDTFLLWMESISHLPLHDLVFRCCHPATNRLPEIDAHSPGSNWDWQRLPTLRSLGICPDVPCAGLPVSVKEVILSSCLPAPSMSWHHRLSLPDRISSYSALHLIQGAEAILQNNLSSSNSPMNISLEPELAYFDCDSKTLLLDDESKALLARLKREGESKGADIDSSLLSSISVEDTLTRSNVFWERLGKASRTVF